MSARISVEELRPAVFGSDPAPARRAPGRTKGRGAATRSDAERLGPRDAGGILDLGLDGLVRCFAPCLGLVLVFWLPFEQLRELFTRAGLDQMAEFLVALLWNGLTLLPKALSASVACSLVGNVLAAEGLGTWSAALRGIRRSPAVTVIVVLTQVVTLPLAALCFVPYVLVLWLTWSAVPLYVLEGHALLTAGEQVLAQRRPLLRLAYVPRRIARAIRRSQQLSSGWPAFGRWLLLALVGLFLLVGVIEGTASYLPTPEVREFLRTRLGLGGGPAEFALATVSGLFLALAASVRGALMTAYYLDLRVRREGLDLELTLRGLERAEVRA